ncbi:MAG: SDR family NAD(P)-dependent oxidoreductase [PS1 clade bacterium]|uniref:SDR family NAD(P)-dependent oxidoreductase n=1 Tax=PS1 clade bacterium TaxID=2175152 RepID=A0A937HH85_9PROT|nr:SDR family NAD(P)-dependent oxidoreductase [PS1 clade bacterium]
MRQFKDKICVITGAASGIGAACALAMAADGALVIGTDLRQDMLAETKAAVEKQGGRMETFMVDVADRDAMFDLAATVEKNHGAADLILNNAGVAFGATVEEMPLDDFKWLMDINFWGVVNGTQAFLPHFRAKGSGHVANVSSIFGLIGVPTQSAYNAAKFGVLGFTEALRHEMRDGNIGVSTIHPGGINTNIVRHARFQQGPDAETEREEAIERFAQLTRTQPDGAAKVIMKGIRKNKARILIGPDAHVVDWIRRLFPANYLRLLPMMDIGRDRD